MECFCVYAWPGLGLDALRFPIWRLCVSARLGEDRRIDLYGGQEVVASTLFPLCRRLFRMRQALRVSFRANEAHFEISGSKPRIENTPKKQMRITIQYKKSCQKYDM